MASVKKDPQAVLDYGRDWTTWLIGTDEIQTSDWFVVGPASEQALALDPGHPPQVDGKVTKCWLYGGVAGENYVLVNRVTTVAGRRDERSLTVVCVER